jgi:hypothetical protein
MEISRKKERCGNTRLVRVATLGSCREVHLDSGPNRLCNLSELFIIFSARDAKRRLVWQTKMIAAFGVPLNQDGTFLYSQIGAQTVENTRFISTVFHSHLCDWNDTSCPTNADRLQSSAVWYGHWHLEDSGLCA